MVETEVTSLCFGSSTVVPPFLSTLTFVAKAFLRMRGFPNTEENFGRLFHGKDPCFVCRLPSLFFLGFSRSEIHRIPDTGLGLEGRQKISLSEAAPGIRGINAGGPQNRFILMSCTENMLPFFRKLLRKAYALSSIFSA
jgi:hypothetical protein